MKHVIIGTGAAGITAAKTIRSLREHDEIVMISADNSVYSRCMLHQFIGGSRSVQGLSFIPDGFFKDNNIRVCAGKTVTGIDTAKKTVTFDNGTESYDKLLIAAGSVSFIPPIDGLQNVKNVYGLHDLTDATAIREKASAADNVVIVGAGLVGLDAAYALLELGKKPVIVDKVDFIISANLDVTAAAVYQSEFEQAGASFRLGHTVGDVQADANGAVSAVVLDNSEKLPCDLLIVAVGVRPNTEFVKNSGIDVEHGITVNKYLTTSDTDVFAAGDVTGLSESWGNALTQGEVAAMNMCGVVTEYDGPTVPQNTVSFFRIPTLSVGQTMPSEGDEVYCCESRGAYQKVIVRDGIPVGVILQGSISHSGFWQHLINNKINVYNIPKPIQKVSFADFYGVKPNGEFEWVYAK